MQTKTHSVIETITNTASGAAISYMLALYVLPYWELNPTHGEAFEITIMFTLASLLRGYAVRRIFNGGTQ